MTLSAPPAARAANFGRGGGSSSGASPTAGGGAQRFKLGPLCRWVMPASDFEAWVDRAAPGERIAYAKGQALARGSATVVLAREFGAMQLVRLHVVAVTGDDGARETEWIAIRCARDGVGSPASPGALPHPQADARGATADVGAGSDAEVLDAIYRAFKRAANMGQVAPTNGELAKSLDLSGPERARYLVRKLIAAGQIRVADQGPRARRIVTIVETGRETVPGVL